MNSKLAEAAYYGDVRELTKLFAKCQESHNSDYRCCFLAQLKPDKSKRKEGGNIFHLSGRNNRVEFFQEAIQLLPDPLVHELLTQTEPDNRWNPLHVAAKVGHLEIVKLIFEFYTNKAQLFEPKPWLELDIKDRTPLHLGLHHKKDECVMQMISMLTNDIEIICDMIDKKGNSLLFMAVSKGCDRVALHILTCVSSYSLSGKNDYTPLHYVMNSSEEVFAKLLDKHPEYKKRVDYTVFRKWAEAGKGKLWPWEYLLKTVGDIKSKKHLVSFIYQANNHGNNIFHVAAKGRKFEAAKTLANVYRSRKETNQDGNVPWLVQNKRKETPIDLAMKAYTSAEVEYKQLRQEIIDDMRMVTEGKRELLFLAIEKQLYQAAEAILHIHSKYGWSLYPSGDLKIWDAAFKHSEEVAKWMAERLLATYEHEEVKHVLRLASEVGAARFIEWMLKKHPDVLRLASRVWIEACERGHFSAVLAFIDNCPYFREICLQEKDTPLHHIKSLTYQQYEEILKHPMVLRLKNFQDFNGETPLHKSIRRLHNILLTEVLLPMDDVIRSTKDNGHETAMDLLVKACMESREWDEMCKRNGIAPWLHTTCFRDKTNLSDARSALLVVATLLATITFTAGFTLPGGVKSDTTGKPALGNKAAFLVFLLFDALSLCCSMLVLVFLLWSMLCDQNRSLLLIDKSMPVLLVALCSTLVTFMTGVYVVNPDKSLWASIVILGMCSIIIISSIPWVMDKILLMFNPSMNRKYYRDEIQLMEEGEATSLLGDRSSWRIQERVCSCIGDSSPQQH